MPIVGLPPHLHLGPGAHRGDCRVVASHGDIECVLLNRRMNSIVHTPSPLYMLLRIMIVYADVTMYNFSSIVRIPTSNYHDSAVVTEFYGVKNSSSAKTGSFRPHPWSERSTEMYCR
jgi:hypothetical protein